MLCLSIFSSIIVADDDTMWAIGVGEHDRNFIANPIPVLRPVPRPMESESSTSWFRTLFPKAESNTEIDIDYSKYDIPAHLGSGLLRKGYKRVSVLYNPGTSPYADESKNNALKGDYYDIILHNGEAYYLQLALDPPTVSGTVSGSSDSSDSSDQFIVDYSAGTNHSILLTK